MDQPIGACLSFYLSVFFHYFLIFFSFLFLFLSACFHFVIFSQRLLLLPPPPPMHGKGPLYNVCRDWLLPFQHLTTFFWSECTCRTLLIHLCQLHHSPSSDKKDYFFLFVCRGTLTCCSVDALSLSLSHSMHLMVPTYHLFLLGDMLFQQDISPKKALARTPKQPQQEPQNRFSPLPTARPCPLTSNT